jgi:hypothetical protein
MALLDWKNEYSSDVQSTDRQHLADPNSPGNKARELSPGEFDYSINPASIVTSKKRICQEDVDGTDFKLNYLCWALLLASPIMVRMLIRRR